jgi:hypothetical protein
MNKPTILRGLSAILVTIFLCGAARATFSTLAQRLPPASNAIIAVNVARIVDSPYGKDAGWGQRLADAWAKQPLMIPPGAQQLIMAADVKPSSFDSYWEMSLIEMDKLPSLETLAKDEGGHIDRVWDKDAVCSPINAYFVPLENNVLASITPAERSEIARWVRLPVKPEGNVTSEYIQGALKGLSDNTDIVMAMDLEGAYGVPNIRKWLDESEIPEVTLQNMNDVVQILGSMKGITLQISVDKKIGAKATVDFDRDTAPMINCAKPIMLAVLNYVGMRIDDVPQWTFATVGKQITMQGDLSDASLRRLLSIVQSPIPAAIAAAPKAGSDDAPAGPTQASQRYFKAICAILDSASAGTSSGATATWIRGASKRIDQLPILNVDPALVDWGGMVSSRLKQAASAGAVGQTTMNARIAGTMDPGYGDYQTGDLGSNVDSSANRTARENYNKQRRQAALEQKAQIQEQALQILSDIADTRPKIRADMVAKYNVEF